METKEFKFRNEQYFIEWTGSAWVSPCNGQQHSNMWSAIESECRYAQIADGDGDDEVDIDSVELID